MMNPLFIWRPAFWAALLALPVSACSAIDPVDPEEVLFRVGLQSQLVKKCADDQACVDAVNAQTKSCMATSHWQASARTEDDRELQRFAREFYACLVDADGHPYFQAGS